MSTHARMPLAAAAFLLLASSTVLRGAEGYHLGDLDTIECFGSAGNLEDCPAGIFIDWNPTGKWTAGVKRDSTYGVSLSASLVGA